MTNIKNEVRDYAATALINNFSNLRAITGKDYTFVLPTGIVDEKGVKQYARIGITSCQMNDTKIRAGFNPETDSVPAAEAFENMLKERDANEAAKVAERAAKKNKEKD